MLNETPFNYSDGTPIRVGDLVILKAPKNDIPNIGKYAFDYQWMIAMDDKARSGTIPFEVQFIQGVGQYYLGRIADHPFTSGEWCGRPLGDVEASWAIKIDSDKLYELVGLREPPKRFPERFGIIAIEDMTNAEH